MDKISLLRERKAAYAKASGEIRAQVDALVDEGSFVELSSFSFSKNLFYEEDACGEGVVTGFATVDGYPFYIVAQNFAVYRGGLSKANCEKIARTLDAAEKNETPVIYLLHSLGVQVGEGVNVLEGIAGLLLKATQLKGTVQQYAVVCGEVYGSSAMLAAVCDCVIFLKEGALCVNSPLVLSAKAGKNMTPAEVGGCKALRRSVLPSLEAESLGDAAKYIAALTELFGIPVVDAELNEPAPALNEAVTAEAVASLLEGGIELGAASCPEVKTVLGRLGGIAVAAVIFGKDTLLDADNVKKIRNFTELACCYALPLVTFVDCLGIRPSLSVNDSPVLKEICEYLSLLDATDTAKIAVVTGSAVGLGYSLFAAKSAGFDYTFALATSRIALFDAAAGAQIEFFHEEKADKDKLLQRYAEETSDPVNAAKGGYLDTVVEPQFVKQYLIASLQMLLK